MSHLKAALEAIANPKENVTYLDGRIEMEGHIPGLSKIDNVCRIFSEAGATVTQEPPALGQLNDKLRHTIKIPKDNGTKASFTVVSDAKGKFDVARYLGVRTAAEILAAKIEKILSKPTPLDGGWSRERAGLGGDETIEGGPSGRS